MNEPYNLLSRFGITEKTNGAVWLLEAVWELASKWDHGAKIGAMGVCSQEWKRHKVHPAYYFGEIKKAAKPILEASEERLNREGLYLEKRTVPYLIWSIAAWMIQN